MTNTVPHRWVAEKLGYSISGVSLLRRGHRRPTLHTMEAVQRAFGWPVADQVEARRHYSVNLEDWISQAHAEEKLNEGRYIEP